MLVAQGVCPRAAKVERHRQTVELAFADRFDAFVNQYLKHEWPASWADAKVGAVANAVVLVGVAMLSLPRQRLDAGDPATLIENMHGTVERGTEQRTRVR